MTTVDINSDLGEAFGAWTCGDDSALLGIVTSANVACGFHAGDPDVMADTFALARDSGVAVGAHPGYADLQGFGRRRIPMSEREIERLVAYQIGAAQAVAALAGHRITHVKAHGALANVASAERGVADAVARAIRAVDRDLVHLAIALTEQMAAGERAGLRVVAEVFADRGYAEDGQLVRRGLPGAMIDDPDAAALRALRMVEDQAVVTVGGRRLPTPVESICVHGDGPHAVDAARRIRAQLAAAGVAIAPFVRG
ncbi:LamB/YcsF family protein [Siculibacillus lacustris]|uniref:5-oxoprolinase subunit A n=1 Tax=Siculibacillus lacustris TaxID=1549641 RepID=A0A4Q9VVR6_9HYPH|nr:5-oxoprolinase subunit PxpA [Siculibacillus lacustris]TBW40270.1 LamB/YcsF family protein [Siculibacillus lacustris]